MQIVNTSIPGTKVIFESIREEVPGGCSIPVARLDNETKNSNVDKRFLPAGTPVYVDLDTNIAQVCKSSTAITGSGAQTLRVAKNNHWKVGDLVNDQVTSAAISSITTSGAAYDTLNVAAVLVYATGTKYGQGSVSGTSVALLYTPNGLTKDTIWIYDGNADSAIVTVGSVREDALTFPINALYAAALRGTKSLITLV